MPIDTGEWLSDPRITNLSYELRGIWLTMLCYMWESPRKGYMAYSDGRPYKQRQLLRDLAIDPLALEIFRENGLLAEDKDGFYSPDMVRKERLSDVRRKAGRKGGESTQSKVVVASPPPEKPPEPIIEPPPIEEPPDPPVADPPEEDTMTSDHGQEQPQEPMLFPIDEIPPSPPEPKPKPKPKTKAKDVSKVRHHYAEFVMMTEEEYTKLCEQYGEDETKGFIKYLDDYKASSGKAYKSDYRTILRWVIRAYYENQQKYGNRYNIPTIAQPAGGVGGATLNATGAYPTATGAGGQPCEEEEKDYYERL